jgi:hypothetical protein
MIMSVEFSPQVTLVAQGLSMSRDEDIIAEVKAIIHRVLNEPDIPVVRATRLASRNDRPGIVKIEVDSEKN